MILEIKGMVDSIPENKLKDVGTLKEVVKRIGLHNDPRMSDHYGVDDSWLRTDGMLQQPNQIVETLIYLSDKGIKTYIEIGTFYGCTGVFICSYLNRFNKIESITTVDMVHTIGRANLNFLQQQGFNIRQILGNSDLIKGEKSDLCFIDGDHSYEWAKRDYDNVGKDAKIVMLHDIQDEWVKDNGVPRLWKELEGEKAEFTYHPDNKKYFGIGVCQKS